MLPPPGRRTALALAVVGLLALPALWSGGPGPGGAPVRGEGIALPRSTEPAVPGVVSLPGPPHEGPSTGPTNWTLGLAVPHPGVDIGEPLTFHAVLPGRPSNYTINWSIPSAPGLHVNATNNEIVSGVPKIAGKWNFSVTATLRATNVSHSARGTLWANASLIVQVGAFPLSGTAPLATDLIAYVSGGSAPYTVSWLTGDQNVGIGHSWNHTYSAAGHYVAEVWVNDTTAYFAPSVGSVFAEVNITVAASHSSKGPFGLPSLVGWGIVAGLGVLIAAGLVYGIATRNRPKRLPPPESWMKRGTEGRAGGATPGRETGGPPPEGPS